MGAGVTLRVRCHSGYTYAQRPQQVFWEDDWQDVIRIAQEWQTPQGRAFQAVCRNQKVLVLHYIENTEEWIINEGFLPV